MTDDRRLSEDIDAEIADHLERRFRALVDTGLAETDAREQATREFGDLSAARRALLSIDARIDTRRRRARVWSGIGGDVRTAVRRLAGQPGATALTILTLALAIGVAAAVFSIVDQLILRSPPFLHADRLVDVWHLTGPKGSGGSVMNAPKTLGWQNQPAVFERLEMYAGTEFDLTDSAEPARISARVVSLGLFDMLGIGMHIGRPFGEGDGTPGSAKVAILSHEFWTTRFGGSPDALGSTISLNDEPHTIIGILRPRTMLITDDEPVWLPFDMEAWGTDAPRLGFRGIGRLNAALNAEQAQVLADAIAEELGKRAPLPGSWYLSIEAKPSAYLTPVTKRTLFVLLGAVGLLLLIACVNVTSFSLGQMLRRERELRLRAAIGAGRWRLFRECLVETMLVATGAGLTAAVISHLSLAALLALTPEGLVFMATRTVEIDLRVLAVMAGVTLIAGLLAGLLPGVRSLRVDLSSALRDGTRGSERGLAFGASVGALVVIEVALAMVLLVGTVLMSRTLLSFYSIDPGFAVHELMTVDIALPSQRYTSEAARRDFFDALDAGLRRHAGISASAHAWGIPPAAGYSAGLLEAEGRPALPTEMEYFTNAVSPRYFAATGTPLRAGRSFTPSDTDETIIVSESFARLLWGGEPAVGRRMRESPDDHWRTVVGVAGDVEARGLSGERSSLQMYMPLISPPGWYASAAVRSQREYTTQRLIVRASNPALVPQAVREQIRILDPHLPIGTFTSGTEIYAEPFAQQQFLLIAMGTLAGIALLLAALGIFGVLSQAVTRRRREIGIRVALGAGTARLVGMLVGRGVALAAIGAVLGTAASMAGVRTLESLLFGVSPFDILSFASVVVLLMVVALVACWWPTRRALAVEPAEVLRSE